MKHFLGLLILVVLASSCSKPQEHTEKTSAKTQEWSPRKLKAWKSLNPYKSEYYKPAVIHPIIGMEKDTFQLGDTLKAKAWFNENISMLKNIAEKEGWRYSIQVEQGDKGRSHFNPNAGDTGVVSFIVQDTTLAPGEVKKKTFALSACFGYWEEEKADLGLLYDTIFIIGQIPYYVSH